MVILVGLLFFVLMHIALLFAAYKHLSTDAFIIILLLHVCWLALSYRDGTLHGYDLLSRKRDSDFPKGAFSAAVETKYSSATAHVNKRGFRESMSCALGPWEVSLWELPPDVRDDHFTDRAYLKEEKAATERQALRRLGAFCKVAPTDNYEELYDACCAKWKNAHGVMTRGWDISTVQYRYKDEPDEI